MMRIAGRLNELNRLSPSVAWKLVDTLFRQTTSMISGAAVFVVLGTVGYIASGSVWYLIGVAYTVGVFLWRFGQARHFARARDSATPEIWARRSIRSGWATALGWGAWSSVVVFEPEKSIVIMVVGMHAGLAAGGAVRNCAVPLVAIGQILLSAIPLAIACVASGDPYLQIYAGIVVMHLFAALALTKALHRQTLQLLLRNQEKTDLVDRLAAANQDLETLVATDALTGVANRRAFDLAATWQWRQGARDQTPLSLLIMDVDHFKAFNDHYGHQAGDACLREIAAAAASALRRPHDLLARYGGEEFAVILPNTPLSGALHIAKAVLSAIEARAVDHDASSFGHVTASIGAACMVPNQVDTVERLTAAADAALYTAKRSGRNRVMATTLEHLTQTA